MSNKQLWYTRRDKEIRGPFPSGMVMRYILLGRITENDELSVDQLSWQRVYDLPELIPEEMKLDLSIPENQEKLRIAKMREDERESIDRREKQQANDYRGTHRRSGKERRRNESNEALRHREIKDQLLASLREKERETYVSRFVWSTFVLVIILSLVMFYP